MGSGFLNPRHKTVLGRIRCSESIKSACFTVLYCGEPGVKAIHVTFSLSLENPENALISPTVFFRRPINYSNTLKDRLVGHLDIHTKPFIIKKNNNLDNIGSLIPLCLHGNIITH